MRATTPPKSPLAPTGAGPGVPPPEWGAEMTLVEVALRAVSVFAAFLVLPLLVGQTEHKLMAHIQAASGRCMPGLPRLGPTGRRRGQVRAEGGHRPRGRGQAALPARPASRSSPTWWRWPSCRSRRCAGLDDPRARSRARRDRGGRARHAHCRVGERQWHALIGAPAGPQTGNLISYELPIVLAVASVCLAGGSPVICPRSPSGGSRTGCSGSCPVRDRLSRRRGRRAPAPPSTPRSPMPNSSWGRGRTPGSASPSSCSPSMPGSWCCPSSSPRCGWVGGTDPSVSTSAGCGPCSRLRRRDPRHLDAGRLAAGPRRPNCSAWPGSGWCPWPCSTRPHRRRGGDGLVSAPRTSARARRHTPGLLKGMATTAKSVMRPTHTAGTRPHAEPTLPPRSRGVIALLEENCTSCMLCARRCPDWCIYIDSLGDDPGDHRGWPGPATQRPRPLRHRLQPVHVLRDLRRCAFDALFWSPQFEYAEYDLRDLLHEEGPAGGVDGDGASATGPR